MPTLEYLPMPSLSLSLSLVVCQSASVLDPRDEITEARGTGALHRLASLVWSTVNGPRPRLD